MNWVDYVILVIVGLSVLLGIWRGLAREALSLMAWVLAIWIMLTFADEAAMLLLPHMESKAGRTIISMTLLFIVTLLVAALVNHLVGQLIKKSGLTGTDRILGLLFGFLRGVAIVVVLVLVAGLTELPKETWWARSQLMHYFQSLAIHLRGLLPYELAAGITYG